MGAVEQGPAVKLDEIEKYAADFGGQDWKAVRIPGGVRFLRDGYVRVVVTWLGGESWLISWEYGMGFGKLETEWRAEVYPTDEVGVQTHMTLNAMWR